MRDLPRGSIPGGLDLILASGSPRRRQLLQAAGYSFEIMPAGDHAECGICSRETAPELVARYAFQKAADIARRTAPREIMILAADTVASCLGRILGKPKDVEHAREILQYLSGRDHDVFTGFCLWDTTSRRGMIEVVRTQLRMLTLSDEMLEEYLASMLWEGKAGAFGYQDGNDWLTILGEGSESNVVGLPMERLAELLEDFDSLAQRLPQLPDDNSNVGNS
ncbi:MAG: Maf family protein [Planctomycetota bacterium]